MSFFDDYNTCVWVCPNCGTKQPGTIQKLKTQYYLQCELKYCGAIINNQTQVFDLANITIKEYLKHTKDAKI